MSLCDPVNADGPAAIAAAVTASNDADEPAREDGRSLAFASPTIVPGVNEFVAVEAVGETGSDAPALGRSTRVTKAVTLKSVNFKMEDMDHDKGSSGGIFYAGFYTGHSAALSRRGRNKANRTRQHSTMFGFSQDLTCEVEQKVIMSVGVRLPLPPPHSSGRLQSLLYTTG